MTGQNCKWVKGDEYKRILSIMRVRKGRVKILETKESAKVKGERRHKHIYYITSPLLTLLNQRVAGNGLKSDHQP